jgi:hypothetical protein
MPLRTFLHNLLNVLVQIANKIADIKYVDLYLVAVYYLVLIENRSNVVKLLPCYMSQKINLICMYTFFRTNT